MNSGTGRVASGQCCHMVSPNAKKKKSASVTIVSQNLRGLKSDVRLDEEGGYQ